LNKRCPYQASFFCFHGRAFDNTSRKAHKIICTLNPDARTMALMNYGAALSEADYQPLMDFACSLKDSQGQHLGLIYAQHMLQSMEAELTVQANAVVLFQITFPPFVPQLKEARMY